MNIPRIPRATYRVQLNRDFGFSQTAAIAPYLHALGISHLYCSPFLKARAGSSHGYDIVDHNALNPELGSREDFNRLSEVLKRHGMGLILDLVPNHMGVGGNDNPWWLDVLENGPASEYAEFFDIDWQPAKPELAARVLLPLLEDHYGKVLEASLLQLQFDANRGQFSIAYHEHRFPIDPRSYPLVLRPALDSLTRGLGASHTACSKCQELIGRFEALPPRWQIAPEQRRTRQYDKETAKLELVTACATHEELRRELADQVQRFNGRTAEPGDFEALHELLEQQAYRLAFWRVAADEINYRRFFDINTLAGLRMERPEVFEATHRLVLELIRQDRLHGLRLDHPDGLYDPASYFARLRAMTTTALGPSDRGPLYTVAEKILARDEPLPPDWHVHGTTGYEFANLLGGLFVHPDGKRPLTRLYRRFTGRLGSFEDLVYECKKLVMHSLLAGELQVLANLVDRFSEADRRTRDYTLNALRDALQEFVACLPVYRTYLSEAGATDQDRSYIHQALTAARRRSPSADLTVFDFLEQLFTQAANGEAPEIVPFVMKLQQYSAPVMAKGLEDTSLYVDNRLLALNEVGGNPRDFGTAIGEFHDENLLRARQWPHSMLTTSTHDTKRSEDVRARLAVLSELPDLWQKRVSVWSRIHRRHKREVHGELLPSRNDEYLLYQTLVGAWPPGAASAPGDFAGRIEAYMIKAVREAKRHTSWLSPNAEYETALTGFVRGVLGSRRFLADFLPFQQQVARLGLLNSLSQTLIKLTAPGVPDIYQGCETWNFTLVDPDNRRPVDFAHLQSQLQSLIELEQTAPPAELPPTLRNMADDGRAKLFVTMRTLRCRAAAPSLFRDGDYRPLATDGPRAAHLVAFARTLGSRQLVIVAPRWMSRLSPSFPAGSAWPDPAAWLDTLIEAPSADCSFTDILSGNVLTPVELNGRHWLPVHRALAAFPVALLQAGASLTEPAGSPSRSATSE